MSPEKTNEAGTGFPDSHGRTRSGLTILCVCALISMLCPQAAKAGEDIRPERLVHTGTSLFKDFDPKAKMTENLSGAVCATPQGCIVVADSMIGLQAIKIDPGQPRYEAGRNFIELFGAYCKDVEDEHACQNWDLEGIARDGETVYFTGSLGVRKSSAKRQSTRWTVVEIVHPEGDAKVRRLATRRTGTLDGLFPESEPDLDRYVDKPLQCGGVNVEGFAFLDGRLYFGLRSPAARNHGIAYVVAARPDRVFGSGPKKDSKRKVYSLRFRKKDGSPRGNIGIRALERFGDRLIIATADAGVDDVKEKHRHRLVKRCRRLVADAIPANLAEDPRMRGRLWIWSPGKSDPVEIGRIDGGDYKRKKLEGVAVLKADGNRADLLLVFDGLDEDHALAIARGVVIPD